MAMLACQLKQGLVWFEIFQQVMSCVEPAGVLRPNTTLHKRSVMSMADRRVRWLLASVLCFWSRSTAFKQAVARQEDSLAALQSLASHIVNGLLR